LTFVEFTLMLKRSIYFRSLQLTSSPVSRSFTTLASRKEAIITTDNGLETPQPDTIAKSPIVRHVPPSLLSLNWDLPCPTDEESSHARKFFQRSPPQMTFSSPKILNIPFTEVPEVAFLGRSNVGKSSLINALLNSNICRTSFKPGHTKLMNAFAVGGQDGRGNPGRINILDMPGYGKGSREEWGQEISKYLRLRKELKRVFVLVDASVGVKSTDQFMLEQLRTDGIPHQVVVSKIDRVLIKKGMKPPLTEAKFATRKDSIIETLEDIKAQVFEHVGRGPPPFGQLIGVSGENLKFSHLSKDYHGALGIDPLRWSILVATGFTPRKQELKKQRQNAIPDKTAEIESEFAPQSRSHT
jgi:GTP-binding protein